MLSNLKNLIAFPKKMSKFYFFVETHSRGAFFSVKIRVLYTSVLTYLYFTIFVIET